MEEYSDYSFAEISAAFPDDKSAHDYFVKVRWPHGVHCAFCQSSQVYNARAKRNRPIWKCRDCKKQFSVTSRTVMESTKLPLRTWLLAFFLLSAHKKSVSALQLSRDFGIAARSAWHLAQRIREAMRDDNADPLYGTVEADVTNLGGTRRRFGRGYTGNKIPTHGMVSRSEIHNTRLGGHTPRGSVGGGGRRNSRAAAIERLGPDEEIVRLGQVKLIALPKGSDLNQRTATTQVTDHVIPDESVLMTDDTPVYNAVGQRFIDHQQVNHSEGEYVRGNAYTNTIEGVFAGLKRQIEGTHHSITERYSQKYLDENAYKYNTRDQSDGERFVRTVKLGEGKRIRLFRPKRGKANALRARRIDGPATHPHKRPRTSYSKRRRAVRRRTTGIRSEDIRALLEQHAERIADEGAKDFEERLAEDKKGS